MRRMSRTIGASTTGSPSISASDTTSPREWPSIRRRTRTSASLTRLAERSGRFAAPQLTYRVAPNQAAVFEPGVDRLLTPARYGDGDRYRLCALRWQGPRMAACAQPARLLPLLAAPLLGAARVVRH